MARSSSLEIAAMAGALVALASVTGCADDGASLHVVCPITAEIDGQKCVFDPESGECVALGVMNLAAASQYDTALSVESGLKPRSSDVPPRAEPNRLSLRGGSVELRKPNGSRLEIAGLENPYPFTGTGTVEPGGQGFMSVTLIPKEYADRLRENVLGENRLSQIIVAVKVRGITDGGQRVESNEWTWPVRLTYESPVAGQGGCLKMDYCLGMEGIDNFAKACVCELPDDSCEL